MQSRLPTAQNPHKNSLISSIPPNPLSRAASSLEREKAMALKTPPLPTLTKSLHPLHPFPSHGDTTLLPHPPLLCTHHPYSLSLSRRTHHSSHSSVPPGCVARNTTLSNTEEHDETEVARGYTMTQFCDKMIDFFMTEKPQTKDWRKILVFRDDWSKYRENFFNRCQARADTEKDPTMKQKLVGLARKVKRIDDEIEKHMDLLKEVQESPLDINAIVARRRKDFTGEFFRHLTVISNTYDTLDDRDAIVRLGAKCLSAVRAYDCALEQLETSDAAQKKFDDILNSSSLDEACEKIKSLAKAKELDSSLVLLINGAWAAAKESTSMTNEVKEIMHSIYKATKKSLRSIAPPEIKLLKYLLNITDPEQRFSVLATAFSPGDEHEAKDVDALYTTPKELHKWITIMLDAYHLNKEETDLTEARQMSDPIIIQRLNILKETIEDEYMKTNKQDEGSELKD